MAFPRRLLPDRVGVGAVEDLPDACHRLPELVLEMHDRVSGAITGNQQRGQLLHKGRALVRERFDTVVRVELREKKVESFLQGGGYADRLREMMLVGHVSHTDKQRALPARMPRFVMHARMKRVVEPEETLKLIVVNAEVNGRLRV